MDIISLSTIKQWFVKGKKPTQLQFWKTWDSFWHKSEKIPITTIDSLTELLDKKASREALESHTNDPKAHGLDKIKLNFDFMEGNSNPNTSVLVSEFVTNNPNKFLIYILNPITQSKKNKGNTLFYYNKGLEQWIQTNKTVGYTGTIELPNFNSIIVKDGLIKEFKEPEGIGFDTIGKTTIK